MNFQPLMKRVILALTIFLCLEGVAGAESPRWPLDLPTRYLTSNFMEYRDGRFHAGIDLKTNSQPGYPVRAVEDGHIVRVRTSPGAYGRAIYIKGNSGRTYVYAHLMRFNDEIRHRVRSAQMKEGRYRVQMYYPQGDWPVARGQVLALSGQSGTGGPHLHFEVRDARGRPVDPQVEGFHVPDTIAPKITGLTAWPVTPEVRINGQKSEYHLSGGAQGLQGELPVLVSDGPVAFSARILEQTDIAGHKLEPWLIEVMLDGVVVYSCHNEGYDFSENSLQRLEWADRAASDNGSFRERWLHRRPGNTLTGRQGDLWYLGSDGLGLPKGTHRLALRAEDRAGNEVSAWVTLVVGDNFSAGSPDWEPMPLGIQGEGFRLTPFFQVGDPGAELRYFTPENGDPVLAPVTLLVKEWHPEPGDTFLNVQGLVPVGAGAYFLTADWTIDADLPVHFPAGGKPVQVSPEVGVYRQGKRGNWNLVDTPRLGADGGLGFGLRAPGLHAVLRDTAPPEISLINGRRVELGTVGSVPGVTPPRWEIVPVQVFDGGAGVAPETIRVQLNGRRLIAEPDLIRDQILLELPDDLPAGSHHLRVEAADEAGHTTIRDFQITTGQP